MSTNDAASVERLHLEYVPLSRLKRDPRNAKQHTPQQLEQMRASIRARGFRDPIGVDEDYNILEGDGRYQAALAEGLTEVPVVLVIDLSPDERAGYSIAHNRTQQNSGLDMHIVHDEIERLAVQESDFMALGFTESDMMFLRETTQVTTGLELPPGEGAQGETNSRDWSALVAPVVQSKVKFDSEHQQLLWYAMLESIERQHPELQTTADRVTKLMELCPV